MLTREPPWRGLWRCSMFESIAFAMGPNLAGGEAGGTDMLMQFLPLILMFVIFWFLLIRPQQKRAKAHKQMLSELKRGDWVVTSSGIIGRIDSIDNETVTLTSETSKLKISRAAIGGLMPAPGGGEEKSKS